MLRIGRIDYLNVWPLFQGLKSLDRSLGGLEVISGHPSCLNQLLSDGNLDLAPSSSFEYLTRVGSYSLLPDLSISADGPVKSVVLVCPFDFKEMPLRVANGLRIGLTSASASSKALLRILWRFHWQWPEPQWTAVAPGQGLDLGNPFLEIGDMALRLTCSSPTGWHIMDLGQAWKEFTGLPFVFGVWMVREGLSPQAEKTLAMVMRSLAVARQEFLRHPHALVHQYPRPEWLSVQALENYWQCIRYDFGPREQAGLMLFGEYARRLGLLTSVPGLRWKHPAAYKKIS
ncbi:MAG TPA: solute-binding protein [Desulfonatronum sp.]|nr:solute-binding protein [Desulfonatronum sp.]